MVWGSEARERFANDLPIAFLRGLFNVFESSFYANAESELMRQLGLGAGQLINVWEKSEDLARRIALLVDIEPPFPIFGRYDEMFDEEDNEADGSHIKPRAFSNLFLAIAQVLTFQPNRTTEHAGLFETSIEVERQIYGDRPIPGANFANWPLRPWQKFIQIRKYRVEDDPLFRASGLCLTELRTHEDALFAAFQENYIFVSDLDEEYEAFIRMFCRLTLILAGSCMDFCGEMASWIERARNIDTASEILAVDERDHAARIVVLSRAIASHGLRVGYASSLETLDARFL